MVEGVLKFCKQNVGEVREVWWALMFAKIMPLPECPKSTYTKSALKNVGSIRERERVEGILNKSTS